MGRKILPTPDYRFDPLFYLPKPVHLRTFAGINAKNFASTMGRISGWNHPYSGNNFPQNGRLYRLGAGVCTGFLWLALLVGCSRDKEAIIRTKVAERVEAFRQKQLAECYTALRRDAEHRVDSLLLAEAKGSLEDSLARLRPSKPIVPPPVLPIDSLSVRPIFDPSRPSSSGN